MARLSRIPCSALLGLQRGCAHSLDSTGYRHASNREVSGGCSAGHRREEGSGDRSYSVQATATRTQVIEAIMSNAKPVVVTRSQKLQTSGGQTEGMIRQNALVDLTNNICASRMIAKPHTASAIHHHEDQDTVVFAFSGHGTVVSEGGKKRENLAPGDFALIPAYAEHQEVNDGDEDVVWCIVRSPGGAPKVTNVTDWGASSA